MPTPHVSSELVQETFANSAKTVRIFPAAEVEAPNPIGSKFIRLFLSETH